MDTERPDSLHKDLQKRIQELKDQKKAVILAHYYQISQVQAVADYLGDSLELARISLKVEKPLIVFCGVKFMAETAKILAPHSKVVLPVIDAGCPLADTIKPEQLKALRAQHPGAWVVSYVNTSADIKALSDVCCTSANAISVVRNVPADEVIFVPDKNLGWWVQKNVPEKKVIVWPGFCYVHEQFTLDDVKQARRLYPDAVIIAHPECQSEVLKSVEYVASTAGMLKVAKEIEVNTVIVGTEMGMIECLQRRYPHKKFYSLGVARACVNMKKTTLEKVYHALEREEYEIDVEEAVRVPAKVALERMVQYL